MKHIKHILFIALFGMANFVAATDSFQPQIIKGRIIEKGTGTPVSNCLLWVCWSREVAVGRYVTGYNDYYSCSDNGEFTITNLSDQVSGCNIELINRDRYHESLFSGPFEPGINDWGTFEVSKRPFYFESCWQQSNMVSATVVNTTGKKAYMRFWLTGQLTRLDDSEYLGCSSEALLKLRRNKKDPTDDYATYQLVPGKNIVQLYVKDYGPNISVSGVKISGGRSYSEPMMPSSRMFLHMWVTVTNTIPLPPVLITNFPPIRITNFPPLITNLPPIRITNLPPYTIASVWTWGSPY